MQLRRLIKEKICEARSFMKEKREENKKDENSASGKIEE